MLDGAAAFATHLQQCSYLGSQSLGRLSELKTVLENMPYEPFVGPSASIASPHGHSPMSPFSHEEHLQLMQPVFSAQSANEAMRRRIAADSSLSRQKYSELTLMLMRKSAENMALAKAKQQKLIAQFAARRAEAAAWQQQQHQLWLEAMARQQQAERERAAHLAQAQATSDQATANSDPLASALHGAEPSAQLDCIHGYVTRMLADSTNALARRAGDEAAALCDWLSAQDSVAESGDGVAAGDGHHTAMLERVQTLLRDVADRVMAAVPSIGGCERGALQVQLSVAEAVYPHLYEALMRHYRARFKAQDVAFRLKLLDMRATTPADLGVKAVFWLVPQADAGSSGARTRATLQAYSGVIECFASLAAQRTPASKLDTLVRGLQGICAAVAAFYEGSGVDPESIAIGAEDLLPLFAYLVTQADARELWAETGFLAEHISDTFAVGEQGYALATTQTALEYLATLQPSRAQPVALPCDDAMSDDVASSPSTYL